MHTLYISVCIHYILVYAYTNMHMCMHTLVRVLVFTNMHMCMHTLHKYAYSCMHTRIRVLVYAYTNMHISVCKRDLQYRL